MPDEWIERTVSGRRIRIRPAAVRRLMASQVRELRGLVLGRARELEAQGEREVADALRAVMERLSEGDTDD